ncbi:uncharacterized protein DSM5745_10134 [Aspergillus mulundensis]|uniref:N-acetylglucosaminylphosphatidylinositol deacetylase n=1 Tax=Aspergillus mulundensis TaxID=1810919 RepID=A0A3D8QMG5_9EURO|nr:hypothetical protein DSM5745_10134 [Aspergillus mulundensis]RDW63023.1 hypothetical protein DSM5745_10134 [Aspergillus mulundensis]
MNPNPQTLISLGLAIAAAFIFWTLSSTTTSPFARTFPHLQNKRICLLIAHPDDEAMFFAPTLLALTKPELGNHVKILCLSSGTLETPTASATSAATNLQRAQNASESAPTTTCSSSMIRNSKMVWGTNGRRATLRLYFRQHSRQTYPRANNPGQATKSPLQQSTSCSPSTPTASQTTSTTALSTTVRAIGCLQ